MKTSNPRTERERQRGTMQKSILLAAESLIIRREQMR